ncbi:MAG: adenylate/guanylate cyclase domain-containing protein [Alphaproteobacteria bacterium]|nr:hypothetical protein [Alphaproteobacteria bacterium]
MQKERVLSFLGVFKGQHRIRFGILGIFVGLLVSSIVLTTTYTHLNIQKAVELTAQDLISKTQKTIVDDTISYFTPAMKIMTLGSSVERAADAPILENAPVIAFLRGCLDALEQTTLVFASDEEGNMVSVGHIPDKRVYLYDLDKPIPHESAYVLDIVDRRGGQYKESRSYIDKTGKELAREYKPNVKPSEQYDNRKRDWYVKTKTELKPNWSDVYPSWFSSDFVVTATVPLFDHKGKFVGALACDIGIDNISLLLRRQKASRSGINFIINKKGEVVAFPDQGKNYIMTHQVQSIVGPEAGMRLAKVNELGENNILEAYNVFLKEGKQHFQYTKEDIRYVANFSYFGDLFSQDWILGLVAPYDDFMGPIREISKDVILISLVILFGSIILLVVFAQKISYPIEVLAGQMRRIRDLDLDPPKPLESHFFEITQMENALNAMREGLSAFGKFVPKNLVRTLIQKGNAVSLGGERRNVAILFSDIENFTSISENMDSDALMNHLSTYISELSNIVLIYKGTIDKYIGDSIMAFWGAPEEDPRAAINACKAALKCSKRLETLNQQWRLKGLPALPTRIGLNFGEVIVGNMGSADRMNYTIIGDQVNLASRLEGINKVYHTYMLISEFVHDALQGSFLTRPLDIVAVKGKEKGVRIFELVAQYTEDPEFAATPEQELWCDLTAQAFEKYLARDWEGSIALYEQVLMKKPKDPVAILYIERCKAFINEPPPEDWDGVLHLHTK